MAVHLAILKNKYLKLILEGEKTIESRFMKGNASPMGRVREGDFLFIKKSGGDVVAFGRITRVEGFEELCREDVEEIHKKYNGQILGDEEYWQYVGESCKCGFLAWLRDVRRIEPIKINKKDMRGWVVLRDGKDFGLLDLVPK